MLVSIIIPAYNRSMVIQRTLNSIIGQSFSDWECIIVDDHSTDNTVDIVHEFMLHDNRFSLITNSRAKGAQGARNDGILHARGEWILLFDSDDTLCPSFLDVMVNCIVDNRTIIACYGRMIEEESGVELELMNSIHSGNIHSKLLNGTNYISQASLINKECLLNIGLLDEKCPSHQELDTHLRLSKYCKYFVVPQVLWHYYVGRSDSISINKEKHIRGLLYISRKHIWDYRFLAYRSFLVKMKRLWHYAGSLPDRSICFRSQILFLAPELPILLLRDKLKWKHI